MADPRTSDGSSTALLDSPPEAEATDQIRRMESDVTDRMYVVAEGDTLSSIARKFYGNASARRRIVEANRALIRDAFSVQPGWRLRIPQ